MALSLLDTPLRKRSDDDQEMKIWRPVHFCVAAGGGHSTALTDHETETMTMNHSDGTTTTTSATPHDDDGDDTDTDDSHSNSNTSKESAALARGAARTAAASSSSSVASAAGRSATTTTAVATRGVMAGRLPISSSTAATTATASSKSMGSTAASTTTRVLGRKAQHLKVPRGGTAASHVKVPRGGAGPPRSTSTPISSARIPKARADSIARVSDRASKGLDVLNAGLDASSESHSHNNTNSRIATSVKQVMQQVVALGKVFIMNTLLGMAVFATYEGMIDHLATSTSNIETTSAMTDSIALQSNYPPDTDECTDVMDQATLPQHFLAGAMGGASHAVLSSVFDIRFVVSPPGDKVLSSSTKGTTRTYRHPILQTLSTKPMQLQVPTLHFSTSSIIHHSLAHSVLFGSYQLTKRVLVSQMHNHNSEDNDNNTTLGYGNNNDTIRVATIALAGGIAGQFQHVISHFSEQWVLLNHTSTTTTTTSPSTSLFRCVTLSSWPTWRSTLMAFPPSAIGFLAFEYGKQLNSSDVDAGIK